MNSRLFIISLLFVSQVSCSSVREVKVVTSPQSECEEIGLVRAQSFISKNDAQLKVIKNVKALNGNTVYFLEEQPEEVIVLVHENAGKTSYQQNGTGYICAKP